jgi:hypothetical protein
MTLYKATLQIPWEYKLPLHKKKVINRRYDINNTLWHMINRHIIPTMLIFPFQVLNLALIVDNTGFQVKSLLGLTPKDNPRYLTGKESLRQKIALAKAKV